MGATTSEMAVSKSLEESRLAREEENKRRDVVIIPVDESQESLHAFQWFFNHLYNGDQKVFVVHCSEVQHPSGKHSPDYVVPPEEWAMRVEEAKKRGSRIHDKYEQHLSDLEARGEVRVGFGRPGPCILNAAKDSNASMIVIGSRGLGVIRRAMLGSVSNYIVQHANVPVTIVPPKTPKTPWY